MKTTRIVFFKSGYQTIPDARDQNVTVLNNFIPLVDLNKDTFRIVPQF
jgi:hypothetical protein